MGTYYVYILSNGTGTTYVGVTGDIESRVAEHKQGNGSIFTSRYKINRLVYYEEHEYVYDAIAREKQIKKWGTAKKRALIESINPKWNDLSTGWYD